MERQLVVVGVGARGGMGGILLLVRCWLLLVVLLVKLR